MIKLLLKIPFLRSRIVKEVFKITYIDQDESAKLEYKFTDSKGNKYYKYLRDELLPYKRYEQMQIRLLEIESRIGRESLLEFSKVLKKFAENKDFLKVAQYIGELEQRLELLYDPELLMRFLSGIYIREDQIQTAHVWNPTLEEEKFHRLMEDNENGNLSFFFQQCSIENHVNFSNTSDIDLQTLWSEPMMQILQKQTRRFDQMISETWSSFFKRKSSNG